MFEIAVHLTGVFIFYATKWHTPLSINCFLLLLLLLGVLWLITSVGFCMPLDCTYREKWHFLFWICSQVIFLTWWILHSHLARVCKATSVFSNFELIISNLSLVLSTLRSLCDWRYIGKTMDLSTRSCTLHVFWLVSAKLQLLASLLRNKIV